MAKFLQHTVAFYLPSSDRNGRTLDAGQLDAARDHVERALAERFGGFTATDAQGGWIGASGQLIREPVRIVRAYAEAYGPADADWLEALAQGIGYMLDQESVAVESPNGFGLVAITG